MEQLIFFAVLIALSILESIVRRNKARSQGEIETVESEEDEAEWARSLPDDRRELPTYDEDPTYDDRLADVEPHRGGTGPAHRGGREGTYDRPRSGADVAAELLAELSRQVERERAPAKPVPAPRRSPPPPRRTGLVGRTEIGSGTEVGEHEIHGAHAGYGTDPSERARSKEDFRPRGPTAAEEDARAVRDLLRSGDASALRRSMILEEVLGPPVSMRKSTTGGSVSTVGARRTE